MLSTYIEFLSKTRPAVRRVTKTHKKSLLAIILQPPIESSDNISSGTSPISIILYRISNINLGYSLMCSIAGFSILAITYFGREVSRNIGSLQSTSAVFSLLNKSRICSRHYDINTFLPLKYAI